MRASPFLKCSTALAAQPNPISPLIFLTPPIVAVFAENASFLFPKFSTALAAQPNPITGLILAIFAENASFFLLFVGLREHNANGGRRLSPTKCC
jgi:hypothetical protein